MRTIERTIYSFNELSEEAREQALNNHLEYFYFEWQDDYLYTELLQDCPFELETRHILFCDSGCSIMGDFSFTGSDWDKIGLTFWEKVLLDYARFELSRTGIECTLEHCYIGAGYPYCEQALISIEHKIDNALRDVLDELYVRIKADFEYQTSMEAFAEMCESMDCEFYENGEIV